jgi:hypothetical protein
MMAGMLADCTLSDMAAVVQRNSDIIPLADILQ